MKANTLLLGLFIFIGTPVNADSCNVITTSAQIDDCTKAAKKIAQKELDDSYVKALDRARSYYKDGAATEYAVVLKNSQKNWVAMRDANCLLEAFEVENGFPAQETIVNSCVSRINLSRKVFLDSLPIN